MINKPSKSKKSTDEDDHEPAAKKPAKAKGMFTQKGCVSSTIYRQTYIAIFDRGALFRAIQYRNA